MKLAILSAGAPRHGLNFSKLLQDISDSQGWGWEIAFWEWRKDGYESYDFSKIDWCWWVGCFERIFDFIQMQDECKHIAQFVGTDILQHSDMVRKGYNDPFWAPDMLLADAPNLVQEARQLTGRDVNLVRSIPPEAYQATPITRWDRILCYVPGGRDDFFRWAWILEIAKDYPDIEFSVLARKETPKEVANVRPIQEITGEEKQRLFESCFAYLRPIEHDGVGLTLIEMAELGRFVFHSDTRIQYVLPARSVGEIEFHLDEILRRKQPPDPAIGAHYAREYSRDKLRGDLESLRQRMGDVLPNA